MSDTDRVTPHNPSASPALRWFLRIAAAVALALIVHNYCLSILPRIVWRVDARQIQPVGSSRAYTIPFDESPADTLWNPRSRVMLTENDVPLGPKHRVPDAVPTRGGGAWSHSPGTITFSTPDGSDPRTNGRRYAVHFPLLYSRAAGYGAIALFGLALCGLRRAGRENPRPLAELPEPPTRALRLHVALGFIVFVATLYFSTGTLSPYGNTLLGVAEKETGYLYNIDHAENRTVFLFVDGAPRETWAKSLTLRRILHSALSWPLAHPLGYETGSVAFNLLANALAYLGAVALVRRRIGTRGAILAAWLLALYPGAAYWVGQPYAYALIFPLSLAGFWVLLELPGAGPARVAGLSLVLGVIYLAYDFQTYFLPASLLLLVARRRIVAAAGSAVLQMAPLALWLCTLKFVVHVPLENSNSGLYREHLLAFFTPHALPEMLARLPALPEIAADVFFGANFLFLPLLTLVAWAADFRMRDFTQPPAAAALLAVGVGLFLFSNVPPPHAGAWNLNGSWIARLYQPLFPALVFALAWWWQHLLPADRVGRVLRGGLVGTVLLGNALIAFGPALDNPLRVSERAFYRFYDHTDAHWAYRYNLDQFGRRPLGFPRKLE